jgi:hypothetical protein
MCTHVVLEISMFMLMMFHKVSQLLFLYKLLAMFSNKLPVPKLVPL